MPVKQIGKDVTAYARSIGYGGDKNVIIQDGKVISHHNMCWHRWCDSIKAKSSS